MKRLEDMFTEVNETTAKTGKRVKDHVTAEHITTRETVAKTGKRVKDHMTAEHTTTRETVAKAGKRVCDRSDANHSDTRDTVRREGEATRRAIRNASDVMGAFEIILGAIFGIIAGVAMWMMEKGNITKPIAFDAAGNVTQYGTDTFMVAVLSLALAAFVFWVVAAVAHAIRRNH